MKYCFRQLASLSKHAEHIFGEMYHDAMRLEHKTNQLKGRVDKLTLRLSTMDSGNDEGENIYQYLCEVKDKERYKDSHLRIFRGIGESKSIQKQFLDRPKDTG